jgi:hypothetical protein
MSELVTKERLEVLASLAVKYLRDAEQAAEIELFDWACVMAGAGIEAGILAHACVCERELRAADLRVLFISPLFCSGSVSRPGALAGMSRRRWSASVAPSSR